RYLEGCPDSLLSSVDYKQAPSGVLHDRRTVALPADLQQRLEAVARSASGPLRSLLLAVHAFVQARLLGQGGIVRRVILNGRPEERDGASVIGSFLNTVPFRIALRGGESWIAYLRRVFATECAILPHRRFPFAELKALRGREPRFDSIFNFTHFHALEGF